MDIVALVNETQTLLLQRISYSMPTTIDKGKKGSARFIFHFLFEFPEKNISCSLDLVVYFNVIHGEKASIG